MRRFVILCALALSLFMTSCVGFGYRTYDCYDCCGCYKPNLEPYAVQCVPVYSSHVEDGNRILTIESPDGTKIFIDNSSTEVSYIR